MHNDLQEDTMLSIFLVGLLLFVLSVSLFKLIFFILGVLLAGAGLILKIVVITLLFIPILPVVILVAGSIFSITSIFIISACGILISYIFQSDRRYHG
jgi:hypothetical protein